MAERMLALRAPSRVRERAQELHGQAYPTPSVDEHTKRVVARFLRGEGEITPQLLVGMHRVLAASATIGRLVMGKRNGAALGKNVPVEITDPKQIVAHAAFRFDTDAQRLEREQKRVLGKLVDRLVIEINAQQEAQRRLAAVQTEDGWMVAASAVSDLVGGAHRPSADLFAAAHEAVHMARVALGFRNEPDFVTVHEQIARAATEYSTARQTLFEYRQKNDAGAETALAALRQVKAVCTDIVTAIASTTGVGLIGGALVYSEAAGGLAVLEDLAEQLSSTNLGLQGHVDVKKLVLDGSRATALAFANQIIGGALASGFGKALGSVVRYRIPQEALIHLMEAEGLASAEAAVAYLGRWSIITDLCGNAVSNTLVTAVESVSRQRRGKEKKWDMDTVFKDVADAVFDNGLQTLLIGAILRRRATKAA